MKKILLTLSIALSAITMAQTTIFQENWDGAGPGIGAWTLYNVDGNTLIGAAAASGDGLPALVTNAWNVLTLSQIQNSGSSTYTTYQYPVNATGMSGSVAACNSWYSPVGIANDWLVSPQISIPVGATSVNLTWAATSLGATAYLENYKVYVSTTGNQVANFTTPLLTVTNELNTRNYRTLNLSSYAGQNIYIAFRADSNDEYVMFLDNIKVAGNVLATSEVTKKRISVHPNPATDFIIIDGMKKINKISITDLAGKRMDVKLDGNNVDVRSLPAGTYLISIETNEGISTEKFIKK